MIPPTDSSRLVAMLEQLLDELVDRRVAAALERLRLQPGPRAGVAAAEWLSQVEAGSVAGVATSTIRAWQKAGLLVRGRRSRVNAGELRDLLRGRGESAPEVGDLAVARAKAAADRILAGGGRGHGRSGR